MPYKILKRNVYVNREYSLIPIRQDDMGPIKEWRNNQLHILRQKQKLTDKKQSIYFQNVITPLFESDNPNQLLFSFLYKDELIGYGGLVHIDWESKRAEISFLLKTERNNDINLFQEDFGHYLFLIKMIAFEELKFKKINTEAYDVRPYLYGPLERSGFLEEARLKSHNFIDGRWVDSVFHSFFFSNYEMPEGKSQNVLVTSISNKVCMLNNVRHAINRLPLSCKLFGGDIDKKCLGRYFVDVFWEMPVLSEASIPALLDYCLNNAIRVIIPTRDGELLFWSTIIPLFKEKGITIMVSPLEAIHNTIDKYLFYKKGIELGYPVIPTALDSANVFTDSYVVKERFGAGAKSIGLNLSAEESVQHSSGLAEAIFQPYIKGAEFSIDLYISQKGEVKGVICRSRDKITNGESQITTICDIPELELICSEFAVKLNLYGHIVFQAIVDDFNKYHILECNARFGGASTLSVFAGLDSFYWFLQESAGEDITTNYFHKNKMPVIQVRHNSDNIFYSNR